MIDPLASVAVSNGHDAKKGVSKMAEIGPVEYMVVAFPGNKFTGDIVPALKELVDSGTVQIIDLAFVSKDADGNVAVMELEDIDSPAGKAFQALEAEIGDLVNEDDLRAVGEVLEPSSSAAVLVWEDVWAAKLAKAIRDAGGVLLDLERVPHEVVKAALSAG
jgi:uncharacterized membrane protein